MHLHDYHHNLLDWYRGKNTLLVTHKQKYIQLIMPLQLMWPQHTICNSPFHTHWLRDREMGPREWVGSGKGQGREGLREKGSTDALGHKCERASQHYSRLPGVEGFFVRTGPKSNAELLCILTLQGTGANSSPIYLLTLQNHEHHKYGKLLCCEKKASKEWENKTTNLY